MGQVVHERHLQGGYKLVLKGRKTGKFLEEAVLIDSSDELLYERSFDFSDEDINVDNTEQLEEFLNTIQDVFQYTESINGEAASTGYSWTTDEISLALHALFHHLLGLIEKEETRLLVAIAISGAIAPIIYDDPQYGQIEATVNRVFWSLLIVLYIFDKRDTD